MSAALVLVALSGVALAQARDVSCKATETQAECHARLKCKPYEELEDCKKRLLRCKANEKLEDCEKRVKEGNTGQQGGADNRDADRDRAERERAERDRADRERAERENADRDRGDRGDRDRDRGNRRDRDDDDRSRRRGGDRDGGRRQRGRRSGGKGFEANKRFGLGLELGEPTGLTGKYFLADGGRVALDFGVGWIYRHYYYREGEGLHLYGDVLFHPTSLVSADAFELPFYIGGGLRFWDFDYCDGGRCDNRGSAIGIRIPIGIAFDFNNVPLDIFIQVVPVIDFINGDYYDRFRDRNHFGIDFSAGIRYWFK